MLKWRFLAQSQWTTKTWWVVLQVKSTPHAGCWGWCSGFKSPLYPLQHELKFVCDKNFNFEPQDGLETFITKVEKMSQGTWEKFNPGCHSDVNLGSWKVTSKKKKKTTFLLARRFLQTQSLTKVNLFQMDSSSTLKMILTLLFKQIKIWRVNNRLNDRS